MFRAQLDATATQAAIGQNVNLTAVQSTSTGSTTTGNSTSDLDATHANTTLPFKIVAAVSDITDSFPDVLVKINPDYHAMTMNTALV